jgi:hypothetical protein
MIDFNEYIHTSAVHLTGNYIPDDDMDQDPYGMMGSSDEEDDMEDSEEDEDDDM